MIMVAAEGSRRLEGIAARAHAPSLNALDKGEFLALSLQQPAKACLSLFNLLLKCFLSFGKELGGKCLNHPCCKIALPDRLLIEAKVVGSVLLLIQQVLFKVWEFHISR